MLHVEVTVNLAVGKEEAKCWRNEVYAQERAHPLLPLGRLTNLLDTKFVWENGTASGSGLQAKAKAAQCSGGGVDSVTATATAAAADDPPQMQHHQRRRGSHAQASAPASSSAAAASSSQGATPWDLSGDFTREMGQST